MKEMIYNINLNYFILAFIVFITIIAFVLFHRNRAFPYKTTFLLSKSESVFYNSLKPLCDKYGYVICPKVGLKDFIAVTSKKNYYKWFNKISQKHVDFLICDKNLRPIMAIELDDKSHELEKAKKNDQFKDELYKHLNFPLKRVKAKQYYNNQDITSLFS